MRISDWSSDVCSSDLEIATLDEALKANEEDIKKLQAKLLEARARQNSIVTRLQSAHNRLRVRELYAGEKVQDAFARFDLLERRVDLAEGRADAMSMGTQRRTLARSEEHTSELQSLMRTSYAVFCFINKITTIHNII